MVSIIGDHHFVLASRLCKVPAVSRKVLLQFLQSVRPAVPLFGTFHIRQHPTVDDQYLRMFFGMDYLVDNVSPN